MLRWCRGSAGRAVLVWLGLPYWGDRTDPLASTGFGLSSCPGGVEKGAKVICWEGASLLLGQVRTDRLTASWRGVKNQDSSRVSHPKEDFLSIVGRCTVCTPAAQCKASIGGPKCRGGDRLPPPRAPLPLQVFPELFQDLARFPSLQGIWSVLLYTAKPGCRREKCL